MNSENKQAETKNVTLADFLEVNETQNIEVTELNANDYLQILFACAEAQNG